MEDKFRSLKSDYFLQKLFDNLERKKLLDIVKYNKYMKQRINIKINDYKEYSEKYSSIEIEIIPKLNEYDCFIIYLTLKIQNIFIFILMIIKKR